MILKCYWLIPGALRAISTALGFKTQESIPLSSECLRFEASRVPSNFSTQSSLKRKVKPFNFSVCLSATPPQSSTAASCHGNGLGQLRSGSQAAGWGRGSCQPAKPQTWEGRPLLLAQRERKNWGDPVGKGGNPHSSSTFGAPLLHEGIKGDFPLFSLKLKNTYVNPCFSSWARGGHSHNA